jgi:ankyrin repeat protein
MAVVELLVAHGAEINQRNSMGASPLHSAAFMARPEVIKFLLSKVEYSLHPVVRPPHIRRFDFFELVTRVF